MKDVRRKLVGSALATPLVLTVRQASARAKTSMAACLQEDANRARPEYVLASAEQQDEWLRAKVDICELSVWNHEKREWVDLKDRRFYLGTDNQTYWQLDSRDPWRAPASPTQYRKGSWVREHKKGVRYMVVHVRSDGKVVGKGWEKNGGQHTTKSCWASVVPKHY
jgi:hypothetical protein